MTVNKDATNRRVKEHDICIVYFGNDWFAENRTSSHHIARRLAGMVPLLYVASPGLRSPRLNRRDLRKLASKARDTFQLPRWLENERLWLCTVPQLPFRRLPFADAFNRSFGLWSIRRAIRHVGFRNVISWFVVPHPGFLAGKFGDDFLVYYCIDDYAAHPGVDVELIRAADRALTKAADQLFVASPKLVEEKRELNPGVAFSPHGVDFDLFRAASDPATPLAPSAARLNHPVIGFFGVFGDWIDKDLVSFMAKARPAWTFLVVGRVATDISRLQPLPNVVFAGPQPYDSLPGWAKAFDVAVIPHLADHPWVRAANPLKLREYLATGKPVVSVPTPEINRFSDWVNIANTHQEFLAAVEHALQTDTEQGRQARWDAVKGMSWERRVEEVWAIVEEGLRRKSLNRTLTRAGG